jgi:putative ABC transport system ATP-binding protein
MIALELRAVSKSHGSGAQQVHALRSTSLSVAGGEIVLLEGPSGAGKTTLLTVAAGLLTPDAGEVELAGESLGKLTQAERRDLRARAAGFVFQRANLLDGLTVRENVLLAAALAGMPRARAAEETDRLLSTLRLDATVSRRPHTLSGGEEHRVAVARALVHRPALIFADEPTGSLDSISGHAVALALATLARESGVAVLVATHDARLREIATRRLWMADGQIRPAEA